MRKVKRYAIAFLCCLLLTFSVNATLAAFQDQSDEMKVYVRTQEIGIEIMTTDSTKDGGGIGRKDLKIGVKADKVGYHYDEKITVANTGNIDEYVRLTLTARWLDENGNEYSNTELNPDWIHFVFDDATMANWAKDTSKTDRETEYYYYKGTNNEDGTVGVLGVGRSLDLTGESWLDTNLLKLCEESVETVYNENTRTVTTSFRYDSVWVEITCETDAVQTHNAEQAVTAAWGNTAWALING